MLRIEVIPPKAKHCYHASGIIQDRSRQFERPPFKFSRFSYGVMIFPESLSSTRRARSMNDPVKLRPDP